MRQWISVLFVILLMGQSMSAQPAHTWNDVEKLESGTLLAVLLWDGNRFRGRIQSASDVRIILVTQSGPDPLSAKPHIIERDEIWRVVQIRETHGVPGPQKCLVLGADAGLVAGSVMGGVRSGNALGALAGGALGLLGGSLAGGLACGTYAIVKSTPQVLHPRDLIYQDDRRPGLSVAH
ncbi:MAG TPA: hypothetical protein VJN69_09990 [Candidatus Acidoferrales bacterium]|jgi:hypothetical protein|nr:hypothetical protein [Candidatus Acidoferrales bacterium]